MKHARSFEVLFLLTASLCACSGSESTASRAPDAPAASTSDPCGTGALPTSFDLGEGERKVIEVAGAAPNTTLLVTGLDLVTSDDTRVVVRAPYGGEQDLDVVVQAKCEAGTREHKVRAHVHAMKWTSLAKWKWTPETTEAPAAREYGTMWIDPADPDRLVVFGGFHYYPKQFTPANDVWSFSLATSAWQPLASDAPARPGGRVAIRPDQKRVVFFGGSISAENGSIDTPTDAFLVDVANDEARFAQVAASGKVSGSYTGSLIYDAPRERFVSACGMTSETGRPHCNVATLEIDAAGRGTWKPLAIAAGARPQGRAGFHYAYDPEGQRLVIFSGERDFGRGSDIDDETWSLELGETPARWVKLEGIGAPVGRRNGAFVYDPVGHRLLMWGGTANGRTSVDGLDVLHLDRGKESWRSLPLPSDVPPRASAQAVFDGARRRMIAGFGNGGSIYTDLWALEL